jgi:phosphoribosylformylglycinamidine (FGAM) synthase-like enzyme
MSDGNMSDREEETQSSPYTNSVLDKMTLELLANKRRGVSANSYKQPDLDTTYETHKSEIKKIIYKLLADPNIDICSDVNDAFDHLVRACVRHIEIQGQKYREYDEELFPTNRMLETPESSEQLRRHTSLWGHQIYKLGGLR